MYYVSIERKRGYLRSKAPQVGLEPTTLRLTDLHGEFVLMQPLVFGICGGNRTQRKRIVPTKNFSRDPFGIENGRTDSFRGSRVLSGTSEATESSRLSYKLVRSRARQPFPKQDDRYRSFSGTLLANSVHRLVSFDSEFCWKSVVIKCRHCTTTCVYANQICPVGPVSFLMTMLEPSLVGSGANDETDR
jgi:hypothetical protein